MALVIATKRGYYKKIREPGDKFEFPLKQGEETGSWMERVGKAENENQQAAEAADAAKSAEDEVDELDLDPNGSDEGDELLS